jgi:hypothetical protein
MKLALAAERQKLERLGFTVKFTGNAPGKCPECKMRAVVDYFDDDPNKPQKLIQICLCDKDRFGCGKKFPLTDGRIATQEVLKVWEISKDVDGERGNLYVSREVFCALAALTGKQIEEWFLQWDNEVIVDTLAKAELAPASANKREGVLCVYRAQPLSLLAAITEQSGPPLHPKCREPYEALTLESTTTTNPKEKSDEVSYKQTRTQKTSGRRDAAGATEQRPARVSQNASGQRRKSQNGDQSRPGARKSGDAPGRAGKTARGAKVSTR